MMKPGLGESSSRIEQKGSTARLKILSKKAGLNTDSPTKNSDQLSSPTSKNPKSFRINQSKQSSQLKMNDSKQIDSRKGSQPSEHLDKHLSSSNNLGKEFYSNRRPSGFPNYLLAYSPRR